MEKDKQSDKKKSKKSGSITPDRTRKLPDYREVPPPPPAPEKKREDDDKAHK